MKKLAIIIACVFMTCSMCQADEVNDLLNYYVKRFNPEKALLVISDKPDETGRFNDIYMELTGVVIERLRIENLIVRMRGVQFNEPANWKSGNVECTDALSVLATSTIYERDINKSIADRTFGKGDGEWHDLMLRIKPEGLSGSGYYKWTILDIRIDINSRLKIVKGKELWLDEPFVKVNKMDLPDYVTRKALARIQPLVNLNKIPLPLTLHKVDLKDGVAKLSSRKMPERLTKGITYKYER